MVIPSGPRNARALLVSAIRDPDPVIFFEAKALYHAAKEEVPDAEETWPIGRARVAREGTDLTLIAYGAMLRRCLEAAERVHAEDGVEVEVVDLLTISPIDPETLAASVRKTGPRRRRPRGAAELRRRRRDRGPHHGGRVPPARGAGPARHRVRHRLPGLRAGAGWLPGPPRAARRPRDARLLAGVRPGPPPAMAREFRLPDLGEGLTEAEIVRSWSRRAT